MGAHGPLKAIAKVRILNGQRLITNGINSKKIFKGDLIPDGWRIGRKMK